MSRRTHLLIRRLPLHRLRSSLPSAPFHRKPIKASRVAFYLSRFQYFRAAILRDRAQEQRLEESGIIFHVEVESPSRDSGLFSLNQRDALHYENEFLELLDVYVESLSSLLRTVGYEFSPEVERFDLPFDLPSPPASSQIRPRSLEAGSAFAQILSSSTSKLRLRYQRMLLCRREMKEVNKIVGHIVPSLRDAYLSNEISRTPLRRFADQVKIKKQGSQLPEIDIEFEEDEGSEMDEDIRSRSRSLPLLAHAFRIPVEAV